MTMINHDTETGDWWWGAGLVVYVDRAKAAIHMLHEQAHGEIPFRTCQSEPCRDLGLDLQGPAPRVLP